MILSITFAIPLYCIGELHLRGLNRSYRSYCQMYIAMYCKGIIGKKSNVPPSADEMCFYAYFLGFKHKSLKQLIQNDEACQMRETMLCQGLNVDLAIFSLQS
uniref:Uncharacterized protein n=2 Tax=Micrurus TaxID=8634 RepID=A0A2D4FPP6_MICCO